MYSRLNLNLGSSCELYFQSAGIIEMYSMLGLETLIFASTFGHVLCLPGVEVNNKGFQLKTKCNL